MRRLLTLLGLGLCLGVTAACLPQPVTRAWTVEDLRWLGAATAPTPATDLLAVYTHTGPLTVDIRADLLDIAQGDRYEVKVSLWDNRSFFVAPLVIDIASDGTVRTSGDGDGKPVIWPRVVQDYNLDTITVSLNRFLLGDHYRVDIATYEPGNSKPADQADNVRSDGQPPAQRAFLVLAFWNAFQVETPAQALRGWDGAHSGPLGGRHGLKYILDGAQQNKLPVALLDLKTPASLAALDYLGQTDRVRFLSQHGWLLLPEAAYSSPNVISLGFSQQAASGFNLPASSFAYEPGSALLPGYPAQFLALPDQSHLAVSGGTKLIPLPAADRVEATETGPALEVRRELVNAMVSPDPADLVVLGGSLPVSTWGEADMAQPTFAWLEGHPWIQALGGADLLTFPGEAKDPPNAQAAPQSSPWLEALNAAPANAATQLAWLLYIQLNEPTADPQLKALRANYLGQVGDLLAAAAWAAHPTAQAGCKDALEVDGQAECVLSTTQYFASFDPRGARLTDLFYLDGNGVHQLAGPTSQFAVGLSDPSEWHPELGLAADPTVIPGAFFDTGDPWDSYKPAVIKGGLQFTSPDGKRVKTFRLSQAGLQVEYQLAGPETTRIPLALDPQVYFSRPSTYRPAIGAGSWTWSLLHGLSVKVTTDAQISAQSYVSSFPFLSLEEDPNLDYPQGHYMPFPVSIVTIQGQGNFEVTIQAK